MILGVISDTHDKLTNIDLALHYFRQQNVDLVIHCGDWKTIETMAYFAEMAHTLSLPVKAVLGNRDVDVDTFITYATGAPGDFNLSKDILELENNGNKIVVTHGHLKPLLNQIFKDESVHLVLRGHSHKPLIQQVSSLLVVNPGSTAFSIPRSALWKPSVAIVDADRLTAEIVILI